MVKFDKIIYFKTDKTVSKYAPKKGNEMKILHASDLHFDKAKFDQILDLEFDVCCISGDLIDASQKGVSEQKAWVRRWLENFKGRIFVCSGNHDVDGSSDAAWMRMPNIYADGDIKMIEGVKFGCVPYMCTDILDFAECDILLTHVPPTRTQTAVECSRDFGDKEFYRVLKHGLLKAKIILCGHVHDPLSRVDKIGNCKIYNSSLGLNIIEI